MPDISRLRAQHGLERRQEHVDRSELSGLEAERHALVLLSGPARDPRPLIGADPQPVDAKALDNRAGRLPSRHQETANAALVKANRKRAQDFLGARRSPFAAEFRLCGANLVWWGGSREGDGTGVEPLRGPAERLVEDGAHAFDRGQVDTIDRPLLLQSGEVLQLRSD